MSDPPTQININARMRRIEAITAYMRRCWQSGDFQHLKREIPYLREELAELAKLLKPVKA